MGCICSKGGSDINGYVENQREKECIKSSKPLYASSKRESIVVQVDGGSGSNGARARLLSKPSSKEIVVSTPRSEDGEKKPFVKEKPLVVHHQRRATPDNGVHLVEPPVCRIVSMPHAIEAEQVAAGWPSWLTSVAAEAIKGWLPRRADSFEKLDKIGQGTYSNVYRARDLETGKIVALKKVRFVNMDPESVRFMAREIHILRRLDHPNVIKLEGLITSRMSGSLYLVFEYMEHDLSGLAASPDIKFTETQIKCYMQQLLRGLEHCHSRGVLHRDIKGSNLLIDNNGILRIADFGLATFFQPDQKQPLTSRVVTLWYRPPELLLGATQYGDGVDLWSAGCILAELLVGKPIMPGRTEVEQLHKIFKLCGSPSEDYWRKARLPHTTIFKPQHPYRRCVSETFNHIPSSSLALIEVLLSVEPEGRRSATSALKSEFFTTKPHPCDPSSLPKYRPSKEFDAKLRNEEARRQRAAAMKGRGSESQRRGSRDAKAVPGQDSSAEKRHTNPNPRSISEKEEDSSRSGFPIVRPRGTAQNGFFHSGPLMDPGAFGSSRVKTVKEYDTEVGPVRVSGPSRNGPESKTQRSHVPDGSMISDHKLNGRFNQHDDVQPSENRWAHHLVDGLTTSQKEVDRVFIKDSTTSYIPKKNRIHYSGPLMPPGGNMDEMLKEHERQIQQAVRKARIDKAKMKIYSGNGQSEALLLTGRNGR